MKAEKKKERPTFVQREVIPAAKKALDYMNNGSKEKPKPKATTAPSKKLKSRSKY